MATIKKRISKCGKISYQTQIRRKGYSPKFATFEKKSDANRWIVLTEAKILEERRFGSSEKHTVKELADHYIREIAPEKGNHGAAQTLHLKFWKEELGSLDLEEVTPKIISEKRDLLSNQYISKGKKRSPATIVRYLGTLSHLFNYAIKELDWIEKSPMTRVSKPKEPRGIVRFLSDDERVRLLDACSSSKNPYLKTAVVVAISTGMRYSEIMNLDWDDIDFDKKRIIINKTKNGERRSVPMESLSFQLLETLKKEKSSNLVFPSRRNTWKQDIPKPACIDRAWRKALQVAEINEFRFHDLRHTCASYLAMNGASVLEIAEILGHKSFEMVKRYAHLCESHTSSLVKNMNDKYFGEK